MVMLPLQVSQSSPLFRDAHLYTLYIDKHQYKH